MRADLSHIPPEHIRQFTEAGHWTSTTSVEQLEHAARSSGEKLALMDSRIKLTYGQYLDRARRFATQLASLGFTRDDVVAIQLPNWTEFAIAVNGCLMAGVPFCQFHSDFRSREVRFICSFTEASALIVPTSFRSFDYLQMVEEIRPDLPKLKHVFAVGDHVPDSYYDLRAFLGGARSPSIPEGELERRRPKGNDLARTAFTSGTTGDPKAVLHTHNTTNCAIRFLNRGQAIESESVLLTFLPVGLNWGLFNTLQAVLAGCTIVYQDMFNAKRALALIEEHRVTHFCCAPAHLVSLLAVEDFDKYDLRSLQVVMTGGASCPIEIIRAVQRRLPGHLLEMYGMLECGTQAHTLLDDDPEAVCGTVGKPLPEMGIRVVDDEGRDLQAGEAGEILTFGPSVTIGYYNNPDANARSFTPDGWFHTGDQGVFDERGYLRIVGRKKEMLIRGGANIYPREIEEVLHQHPKVQDAAVVGLPDARLGERVCACIVPRPGETFSFDEMISFLKGKIATYKLPEALEVMDALPRTPTGKVQKVQLRQVVEEKRVRAS